jgi:hypothetical protein
MEPRHGPAALLAASANLQLEIQIRAVHLFQNASVLPYHSVYESVLAFVEPLPLIFAEVYPRFLDKTHPGPVKINRSHTALLLPLLSSCFACGDHEWRQCVERF